MHSYVRFTAGPKYADISSIRNLYRYITIIFILQERKISTTLVIEETVHFETKISYKTRTIQIRQIQIRQL